MIICFTNFFLVQNLPPVQTVGVGVCSTKNSLVAVSFRKQVLIPLVLRCDYSAVRMLMEQLKGKLGEICLVDYMYVCVFIGDVHPKFV